jgi:hypothetical protein
MDQAVLATLEIAFWIICIQAATIHKLLQER